MRTETSATWARTATDRTTILESIVRQLPAGVVVAEAPSGRLVFGNAEMERIFGHALIPGTAEYEEWDEFHPGGARLRADEHALSRALRGETIAEEEVEIVRADGTRARVVVNAAPLRDGRGEIAAAVAVMNDVTESRRAEDALRESERRFRSVFENMAEGFAVGEVLCDDGGKPRDFRFVEMNDAFETQSGLRRAEVRGRPMREVLPGLEESWIENYGRVALSGKSLRFESYNRDLGRLFSVVCFSPGPGRFATLFTDVTERERASAELRHAAELLELGDALIELDRDWRIVRVNASLERLSGKPRSESVGRLLWEVWPSASRADSRYVREYRRCMEERVPVQFDAYYEPLDVWTAVTAYPTSRGGIAAFTRVVNDRKRAEAALQEANARLLEADRRKDEFLGMLSHELRNPLAPIRNALYVLDHAEPAGPEALRACEVMRRQLAHLTRLVDDLLDVTRIARGKIELRRADVELADLVRRAGEDHRALLQERGIELVVEAPGGAVPVHGDETRLAQVIGNLLQNAAKFTGRGGRVTLSIASAEGGAEIRVRDTGAGIEPEFLAHVFEPFTQGKQPLARTDGGLGLGLALVRGLVELHGGTVTATSAGAGCGAEFTICLPAPARGGSRPGNGTRPARKGGARRRVLVVDDRRDAAESLADVIRILGHEAEVAFDGASAVELALRTAPDVVLCDIGLPGTTGYDVARALRAGLGSGICLYAVSGYAQPEDVRRAAEAGFDGHVAKPPDPARIERLLS